jgi:DNA-binding response OmpR family regulator
MNQGPSSLSLLYLGIPGDDAHRALDWVGRASRLMGRSMPRLLLSSDNAALAKAISRSHLANAVALLSAVDTRSFSRMYCDVRTILGTECVRTVEPVIRRGAYSLDPALRTVSFADQVIGLGDAEFDIAIELFYQAGLMVTNKWLLLMVPFIGSVRPLRLEALDSIVTTVRNKLRLDGTHGWTLTAFERVGYRLARDFSA